MFPASSSARRSTEAMRLLRTGGAALGQRDPSSEAGLMLRTYVQALGKAQRIRIEASSAACTLIVEKQVAPGKWQLARSITRPSAIDAIRALVGNAESSRVREDPAPEPAT